MGAFCNNFSTMRGTNYTCVAFRDSNNEFEKMRFDNKGICGVIKTSRSKPDVGAYFDE